VAIRESFKVDVRVDQAGPRPPAKLDYFGAAPRRSPRRLAHGQDPPVNARCNLRLATREQRGLIHRP
jgi:hypothetical protein